MKKQQGMTLIGSLMTMIVIVMAVVLVMRIVPVVIEHYTIVSSIKNLSDTPVADSDPVSAVAALKNSLMKRLDINEVNDLKDNQISITPDGEHKYKVRLKYQVIKPLMFNMNLLFDYDDTIEVTVSSEN